MQAGQLRVLLFPQTVDPLLEGQAVSVVLIVVATDEFPRNLHLSEVHLHGVEAAAEQVPETRYAVLIVDGDVNDGMQLFAHSIEHEGDAARLGFQQVLER